MTKNRALSLLGSRTLIWSLLGGGATLFHLSLYSLSTSHPWPLYALLAGIFLQASSTTLFAVQLFKNNGDPGFSNTFCSQFLFVLSLSLSLTRLSRFSGFSGFDFPREGQVLENTVRNDYWDPGLGPFSNYQSSLAVTVLPTMLSHALQVPAETIFLLQTFLFLAMLPLVVLAVVKSLTGDMRLATVSGLLVAQNWFFFGAHVIGKTSPALFLAALAFYCLTRQDGALQSLGVLFSLGVAMSHYTIALLVIFLLLSLVVFAKAVTPVLRSLPYFSSSSQVPVSMRYILLSVGLITLWLSFAAPNVLSDAGLAARQVSFSFSNLASGPKRVDTSLAVSGSAGPLVTGWFDFQNGLIGLGGLIMLNRYRGGRATGPLASWILVGSSLIILLGAWIVLPWLSVRVESTRILAMILPFVGMFPASMLMHGSWYRFRIWKIMALGIIFLMIPMNLMLPNQERNILFHQPSSFSLDKNLDLDSSYLPSQSNVATAAWASNYLPTEKPVEVDAVGRYALLTALPFPPRFGFAEETSPAYNFKRYDILSSYLMEDKIWSVATLGTRILISADPAPFFSPHHDILYSSPRFWIVSPFQ